jgi:hypothetical protein
MRRWPAGALFFAGWVGLLGLITWRVRQATFPNQPYWSTVGVLVGIAAAFLLVWWYDYPHFLRVPLALGIVWLLVLPFIPPTADIMLVRQSSRIQIGMTEAEVRTIMAGYRSRGSGFAHADGVVGVAFCTDDPLCETSAQVQFASGQVVRTWVDTD